MAAETMMTRRVPARDLAQGDLLVGSQGETFPLLRVQREYYRGGCLAGIRVYYRRRPWPSEHPDWNRPDVFVKRGVYFHPWSDALVRV